MIKSDTWIKKMAAEHKMIEPFAAEQVRQGVISYGVSSYGYDMRVAGEFKIFSSANEGIIDPKDANSMSYIDVQSHDHVLIPPRSLALARSVEYFRIPRNILTIAFGKSTYARCGVIVNITPFEPEWEGFVTLGITNTSPLPAKIYVNEGIAQVLFLESDQVCQVSYADRKGKYQAQQTVTQAKI